MTNVNEITESDVVKWIEMKRKQASETCGFEVRRMELTATNYHGRPTVSWSMNSATECVALCETFDEAVTKINHFARLDLQSRAELKRKEALDITTEADRLEALLSGTIEPNIVRQNLNRIPGEI